MKIIGKTDNGYLVEMATHEVAHCAGVNRLDEVVGWSRSGSYSNDGQFPIGTKIAVTESYRYMHKLREQEAQVKTAANFMRQLADMVDAGLPTTIVLPDTPTEG